MTQAKLLGALSEILGTKVIGVDVSINQTDYPNLKINRLIIACFTQEFEVKASTLYASVNAYRTVIVPNDDVLNRITGNISTVIQS
jgi:predicted membrane protein